METLNRRGLITGLGALFIAAPAIVRASSLMPVKAIDVGHVPYEEMYSEWVAITRKAFVPRMFVQLYVTSPLLGHLITSADPSQEGRRTDTPVGALTGARHATAKEVHRPHTLGRGTHR